jgi:hypothetical protein
MCLPVVLRFMVIIWMLFFTYGVVSVEILNEDSDKSNVYTPMACKLDEIDVIFI